MKRQEARLNRWPVLLLTIAFVACDRQPTPPAPQPGGPPASALPEVKDEAQELAASMPARAPDEKFQPGVKSHANRWGIVNELCPWCGKLLHESRYEPEVHCMRDAGDRSFGVDSECINRLLADPNYEEKLAKVRLKPTE